MGLGQQKVGDVIEEAHTITTCLLAQSPADGAIHAWPKDLQQKLMYNSH